MENSIISDIKSRLRSVTLPRKNIIFATFLRSLPSSALSSPTQPRITITMSLIPWKKYEVHDIRPILRRYGADDSGDFDTCIQRLQLIRDNESFTPFPRLPVEIRCQIWRYALAEQGRQMVKPIYTQVSDGPTASNVKFYRDCLGNPFAFSILAACKESFEVASRRYQPQPGHS